MRRGTAPLLISMPHTGTFLPSDVSARLTHVALKLPDTDWHLERLYDFVDQLGASVIIATHSRYAIDLNRPPDDTSLYPGQDTTGLCPLDTFDRDPLYREGQQPDAAEMRGRIEKYWKPYHAALRDELDRLRERYDRVVLWDAHSIRSVVPRFFPGRLPDLNLGSAGGSSCDQSLAQRLVQIARDCPGYTGVLDGRFKGGYITRRYGRPKEGVHAIQLELAQITYMQEEFPYSFDENRARTLRPPLKQMLREALRWV
ncbi:MAG TPA: N-formylglutamate deformylase [Burkholderiales bacterium]|nr:N-formylglutamate deformylase [Burkholderiales bacterium]